MDQVRELSSNGALNIRVSSFNSNAALTLVIWRTCRATLCPFTVQKTKAERSAFTGVWQLIAAFSSCLLFYKLKQTFVFLTFNLLAQIFFFINLYRENKCKFSSEKQIKAWKTLVINVAYQTVSVGGENLWVIYIKSKEIELGIQGHVANDFPRPFEAHHTQSSLNAFIISIILITSAFIRMHHIHH